MDEVKYEEKWKYLSECCLNITDACNLACHYCFVQQKPHFMTLSTAKDAVDWLYNNHQIKIQKNLIKKNSHPRINFFGGEPTLLWDDIIKPLTLYTREKYQNDFHIGITTNGTLLNEDRINFLYENKVGILLSMDGDRETQELTRPCQDKSKSSFDMVINNIPLLLKLYPNLTYRATINQENVQNMFYNYLFIESLGFRQFYFSPNEREPWSENNLQILEEEVQKIFYHQFIYYKYNIPPLLNSSLIDDGYRHAINIYYQKSNGNQMTKDSANFSYHNRCGLGTNYGSINYLGEIFGCQEQDSRQDTNSIFKIGDIYNGIDENKQLQLISMYLRDSDRQCENINICKNCHIYNTCSKDMCPSTSMDLYQNFKIKSEVQCRYKNAFTNNALIIMQLLINNDTFFNYLKELSDMTTTNQKWRTYNGYK